MGRRRRTGWRRRDTIEVGAVGWRAEKKRSGRRAVERSVLVGRDGGYEERREKNFEIWEGGEGCGCGVGFLIFGGVFFFFWFG